MIYIKLFFCFLQIGFLSIGGGYATLPLIQEQVVETNKWLTMESFTDLITISQMTPGPIAINSSTFTGMQIAGIPGAVVSTFALILPSFVIILTLAFFYNKSMDSVVVKGILIGLRPVVIALIACAGLSIIFTAFWESNNLVTVLMNIDNINFTAVILFVLSLFALRKLKLNPIFVMVLTGIIGMGVYTFIL